MKNLTLFLILVFFTHLSNAQKKISVYGEIGGGGSYENFFVKGGLNGIFLTDNVISLHYAWYNVVAGNEPQDYYPGFVLIGKGRPRNTYGAFHLTYGKMITTSTPQIRFALKGGLSLGSTEYASQYVPSQGGGWLVDGSNYDIIYEKTFVAGIHLNPTIEFLLARRGGATLGLFADINTFKSIFGFHLTAIFGKLREPIAKAPDFK